MESILSAVNPLLPKRAWDYLLCQAELTLNLLWNSRINLKQSSLEFLFGIYNENATPTATVGSKDLVHVKNEKRGHA